MSEIDEFRARYESHVRRVVSGDMKAAVADMVPDAVPAVFEGVDVPRGAVDDFEIVGVRPDGDRMVGEAVYISAERSIGLRSYWVRYDDDWRAAALENFPTTSRDRR
ncbi:hypothetical protein [Gordonia soli]|uniref:SnoaL-like domain-containing protein n=1 Tax=Gordonia soli NBRC 108243 TaxID=1223545 RepID=M0QIQ0_9ACTN|nr:hypothetical protein GS4_16_00250 [Gordonia soli NBRC 108243]